MSRERITVHGQVQGVGFRPFVFRLAREMRLGGWVRNEGAGVVIEAEGEQVERFVRRLSMAPPDGARVESVERADVAPLGETRLRIIESLAAASSPRPAPDRATCAECLAEVLDPDSRHFDYPFTNCTRCGPRYTIIDRLPYDRANTAMARFAMCGACRREYEDPASRRFHAQPTACPACGPAPTLRDADAQVIVAGTHTLDVTADRLSRGAIIALKGLGGYQLLTDARDGDAVARLRALKCRPDKPFAVMVRDLAAARELARVSAAEARLLASPANPIVLLRARDPDLAATLHPCHAEIGVMLPTTPLHHLLARRVGRALVCTSGNLGDEPICIDDDEARERLGGVADAFLVHDRPIRRPVDDSLARVVGGAPQVLRLGRGYAPLVLALDTGAPAIATGAQQKNALAVSTGERAVVGPHVGDLWSARSVEAMQRQASVLPEFFEVHPERVARDLHPDYASSHLAEAMELPVFPVQHHLAHALAVMAEHDLRGPVLALTWDGTGLGTDGQVWGGECLRVERTTDHVRWERVAHLRPFRLPGGDAAAREPRRALAGVLWEITGHRQQVPEELVPLLERGLNTPWCTSMGRLFDAVAAALGHDRRQTCEGMAASLVERDARGADRAALTPLRIVPGQPAVLDWEPMMIALLGAVARGEDRRALGAAFHRCLADAAAAITAQSGLSTVILTGGCFQNRLLTVAASRAIRKTGCTVVLPRRLPPNDGGIALGQLAALDRRSRSCA